jgi:hypothetical protein
MRFARILFLSMSFGSVMLAADADPFLGRWKLNWGKSHHSGPAPKSAIRNYTKSGAGVRVREEWVDLDGTRTRLDYKANYDGKDYPVRMTKGGTVAFTRPDDFTVVGVSKADGKPNYTFRRIVSKDRKTLTIEMTKSDSTGSPSTEVLVYERIERM